MKKVLFPPRMFASIESAWLRFDHESLASAGRLFPLPVIRPVARRNLAALGLTVTVTGITVLFPGCAFPLVPGFCLVLLAGGIGLSPADILSPVRPVIVLLAALHLAAHSTFRLSGKCLLRVCLLRVIHLLKTIFGARVFLLRELSGRSFTGKLISHRPLSRKSFPGFRGRLFRLLSTLKGIRLLPGCSVLF